MFRDWYKFKEYICELKGLCEKCFSDNIHHFLSRIVEYDKDWEYFDDHDDMVGYEAYKCEDCGYDTC